MFTWYQKSAKCYVYLSDVSSDGDSQETGEAPSWIPAFRRSRWFTRGWTLQELIAPRSVEFFSREGKRLGDKTSLEKLLHQITNIPVRALQGCPLTEFSIDERMSWYTGRNSTREEDSAYCLLGIFQVFMPLIYGEGRDHALKRLHQEIFSMNQSRAAGSLFIEEKQDSKRAGRSPDFEPVQPSQEQANLGISIPGPLYASPLVGDSFRLFVLEPGSMESIITGHLVEYDLLHMPAYYAMSYAWGSESDIHNIVVNGNNFLVRPNLFQALLRVRS